MTFKVLEVTILTESGKRVCIENDDAGVSFYPIYNDSFDRRDMDDIIAAIKLIESSNEE